MKIGLFDHVELADRPLATTYNERLDYVCAADEAGFYAYQVAEHHCTPLNMVPVPGAYLGAVARLTKRIHFGPLVYLLPLYSPLRLAEEIAMLDHLSNGRYEIGVGRGVSPFELNFHKVDHADSREIFIDAYNCLREALKGEEFSYDGKYFQYKDVPVPLRPLSETLHFWYGSSNTIGAAWAGQHGMHFAANGPTSVAAENIACFRAELDKRGGPAAPKAGFKGGCVVGALRHIVVADTDAEAERIARPAFGYHGAHLNWLRNRNGSTEFTGRLGVHTNMTYEFCVDAGMLIAGSPATVIKALRAQAPELNINYLLAYLFFGTMSSHDAMRSLNLFATEVMPELADL